MSDRNDGKLRQVPVGTYTYRHEAEFAAGFLKSAGIPYRLQIEDPTLGLSASESATLWVHAMDERRAREVLDQENALQEGEAGEGSGEGGWAEDDRWAGEDDGWAGEDDLARGDDLARRDGVARGGGTGRRSEVELDSEPGTDLQGNMKPDLTLRERVIAIIGGLGVSSLMGLDVVLDAHATIPWTVAIVAVALVLAGVLGRAPGPLKSLLSSLSGDAP